MEYLFDVPFIRTTPQCFKDNNTKLILDGYNDNIKIAFEYNGLQHYQHVKIFHKNKSDYYGQIVRDCEKMMLCDKYNINLIIIPYYVKHNEIFNFIKSECKKLYITHKDKPYKPPEALNMYNNMIEEKNILIDKKLEGTNFKRFSSFISTQNEILIKCVKCNNFERKVLYGNLMKRNVLKCYSCFHTQKQEKLDEILIKENYKSIDKYTYRAPKMKIQCILCDNIRYIWPDDFIKKEHIKKCSNCS